MTSLDPDVVFKGMGAAPSRGSKSTRVYFQNGNYKVQIKRIELKASEKKRGEVFFICEVKVVESSNPAHAVGSTASWSPRIDEWGNTFRDINALLCAAMFDTDVRDLADGSEDRKCIELAARAICGSDAARAELEAKPYELNDPEGEVLGKTVALECSPITLKNGNPFTAHRWSPVAS